MQKILQILPLKSLVPAAFLIRVGVDAARLDELACSVKVHGVLQPILVRPSRVQEGKFEVVCGARRWKAAEKAGLDAVPCVVAELSDQEAMEYAFIENNQRDDLTDYERGRWLKEMMQRFPEAYPTQEAVAGKIGKTRVYVAYMIAHYEELERQKEKLPANIVTTVTMLPERVVREVRSAPEDVKPKIIEYAVKHEREHRLKNVAGLVEALKKAPPEVRVKVAEAAVDKGLTAPEAEALVEAVTVKPVSVEEAFAEVKAETEKRVEARRRMEKKLIDKLAQYYPLNLLDEALKIVGEASEEKTVKFLRDVVSAAWDKLSALKLTDEVLQEAKKWS
ncbi:MAG: ParB/RepB/Spo0J family partition protein [Bacteroidota bacterium]